MACRISTTEAAKTEEMLIKAAGAGDETTMRQCYANLRATHADERIKAIVNRAMIHAAWGDHKSAVHLCCDEWGATVNEQRLKAFVVRYRSGDPDKVWANTDNGQMLHQVAVGDEIWGVELFLNQTEYLMIDLARAGDEAAMRKCYAELWATYADKEERIKSIVNRAIIHAARGGHTSVVQMCRDEWGATVDEQRLNAVAMRHQDGETPKIWAATKGGRLTEEAIGDEIWDKGLHHPAAL